MKNRVGRIFSFKGSSDQKELIIKVGIEKAKPGWLVEDEIITYGAIRLGSIEVKIDNRGRLGYLRKESAQPGDIVVALEKKEQEGYVLSAEAALAKAARGFLSAKIRSAAVPGVEEMQVYNAKSDLQKAEGELKRACGAEDRLVFRAPFVGIIGATKYSVGDIVGGDDCITTFAELPDKAKRNVTAVAHISQNEAQYIILNKEVSVVLPNGAMCKGLVTKVDRILNDFGHMQFEVTFNLRGHAGFVADKMNVVIKLAKTKPIQEEKTYVVRKSAIASTTDTDDAKIPKYIHIVKDYDPEKETGRAMKVRVFVKATGSGEYSKYCKVYSPDEAIEWYATSASISMDGALVKRIRREKGDPMEELSDKILVTRSKPAIEELKQKVSDIKKAVSELEAEEKLIEKEIENRLSETRESLDYHKTGDTEDFISEALDSKALDWGDK